MQEHPDALVISLYLDEFELVTAENLKFFIFKTNYFKIDRNLSNIKLKLKALIFISNFSTVI